MYGRGNVLVGKCPVGELSVRGNVCSGKCPSGKCPSGKCQSGNCPRGSVSRGTVQSGNCPHTLNFNEKHSNMLIYKTLEKSWILNILRKESIFLYSKRKKFFRRIGVFTSLGVAIFRVTLRDRAQIFLKKATIYENDDSICFHFLYTDQTWRLKRM